MLSVYLDDFEVYCACAGFRREKERDRKNSRFDGMDSASSVTMNDGQLKGDLKTLDEKSSLAESSSASKKKDLRLPAQAKQVSLLGESEDVKGKTVMTDYLSKHLGSCKYS